MESFPAWKDGHDTAPHPPSPNIHWKDLTSLDAKEDVANDSEVEEEDLLDADSHVPLNEAARQALGDGPTPDQVTSMTTMLCS